VKERLVRVAKLLVFPAFYLFSLGLFGYLTFPYSRLKDRAVAEIEKHSKPGQRLEIGKLSPYWITGFEVSSVKLHLPPDPPAPALPGSADFGAPATPAKESVLAIDEAHVRVRMLPLLLGRVRVDFSVSAFGGEIKGTAPVGATKGEIEIEVDHVDLSKVEPLAQAIGLPLKGTATGKLSLDAPDGKLTKAGGTLDLTLADVVVSDGKTKIQGLIELPAAKLGDVAIAAEAKDGTLKVTKLAANGADLEIVGDGKISLKDPWADSLADLFVRFKFTDAYRGKNGTTKSLLGEPGSSIPGLMEMQVPKMKRAKRPDGFFGWHVSGSLKRLRFDPSTAEYSATGMGATGVPAVPKRPLGRGTDSPFGGAKRPFPVTPPKEREEPTPAPEVTHTPEPPRALPQLAPPPVPPPPPPPAATPAPAPVPAPVPTPAPQEAPAPQQPEVPPAPEAPQ
jgi:type II secretion system protein N